MVTSTLTVMSRSSLADEEVIQAPTTPSDAMQISDVASNSDSEEESLSLTFNCVVYMISGNFLGPFKCDERTSVGHIRHRLMEVLEGELDWGGFELVRNTHILKNDYTKVYELRDVDTVDCLLTVVPIRNKVFDPID